MQVGLIVKLTLKPHAQRLPTEAPPLNMAYFVHDSPRLHITADIQERASRHLNSVLHACAFSTCGEFCEGFEGSPDLAQESEGAS